jgi:hypothetical protein
VELLKSLAVRCELSIDSSTLCKGWLAQALPASELLHTCSCIISECAWRTTCTKHLITHLEQVSDLLHSMNGRLPHDS